VGETENGNVLAHWATGLQIFFPALGYDQTEDENTLPFEAFFVVVFFRLLFCFNW